jgi:hypothetical protein
MLNLMQLRRPGVAFAVVLLLATPSRAQDERRDGNWWNMQPANRKAEFVTGFFDGMLLGKMYSQPLVESTATGGFDQLQLRERDAVEARFAARTKKYLENVSDGQISDGLNEFYKDFRNRSIRVFYAVDIVLRQIAGEKVDSAVESLRRYAGGR